MMTPCPGVMTVMFNGGTSYLLKLLIQIFEVKYCGQCPMIQFTLPHALSLKFGFNKPSTPAELFTTCFWIFYIHLKSFDSTCM